MANAKIIPYLYRDTAKGVSVTVGMLRYWRDPEAPTTPKPLYRTPRVTLAEILADVDAMLAVEKHRAQYVVPSALKPRDDVTTRATPQAPYQPRVIAMDEAGYTPVLTFTRAELLQQVLEAARYA